MNASTTKNIEMLFADSLEMIKTDIYGNSTPGMFQESYSPISSSDTLTQVGPISQFSTKDNLSLLNHSRGDYIKQRLRSVVPEVEQIECYKSNLILGLPVLYYPDIEIIRREMQHQMTAGTLQRARFGYRAACCIGFVSEQIALDRNVLAFVKECERFQKICVPLCEVIVTKRMEIYAFLEAVDLFRSKLMRRCSAIQKLHLRAKEYNFKRFGYLKKAKFIKECRGIKESLKAVENTKLELHGILSEIKEELVNVDQSTKKATAIEDQWVTIQKLFEVLHDKYGYQDYLMETYTFPLWHYFDQAGSLLETDSWKIFIEFAQAQIHFKQDISVAEESLLLSGEHIMWSQLALLRIESCARDCGRLLEGDIPHARDLHAR